MKSIPQASKKHQRQLLIHEHVYLIFNETNKEKSHVCERYTATNGGLRDEFLSHTDISSAGSYCIYNIYSFPLIFVIVIIMISKSLV
jgi:hypothetical protein